MIIDILTIIGSWLLAALMFATPLVIVCLCVIREVKFDGRMGFVFVFVRLLIVVAFSGWMMGYQPRGIDFTPISNNPLETLAYAQLGVFLGLELVMVCLFAPVLLGEGLAELEHWLRHRKRQAVSMETPPHAEES